MPTPSCGVVLTAQRIGLAVLLCIGFSGVAQADLAGAARYQAMLLALKQDGWNGTPAPAYYAALVRRATEDADNQQLQELRYYCEILPTCAPRDVYVIMIWGAGGRFRPADLTATNGYNDYVPVYRQLHQGNLKGALLVGFWDNYFARRDDQVDANHEPGEPWPTWHIVHGSPWTPGLAQLQAFVAMIPRDAKLIIAGASLGGGTAATLARMLADAGRPIDHLLVFDPAGIYGKRSEAIAHTVPGNVRRFFNIWQERGCWPADYLLSGRFHIDNPQYTTATQELYTGAGDAGPCIESVSKSIHSDTWRHRHDGMQRIAHELLSAVNQATAPPPHLSQTHDIDGSSVTVSSTEGSDPTVVAFDLSTTMAWWTGIRIHRANGAPYRIEREHGDGPYNVHIGSLQRGTATLSIPVSQLARQIRIEFWTAKAFGAHTYMAETVVSLEEARGRLVTVDWPKPR